MDIAVFLNAVFVEIIVAPKELRGQGKGLGGLYDDRGGEEILTSLHLLHQ